MKVLTDALRNLGLEAAKLQDGDLVKASPINGKEVARLVESPVTDMAAVIASAQSAFAVWRQVPAPRRGELIRLLGEELRKAKQDLGTIVTVEVGKILQEGLGEVQEMIDICDLAVGLSRQLYGLTMVSERPGHRIMEQWHPLGPAGVITAFNFPCAVWSWNAALALVCGDPVIWKPSEKAPLTALAVQAVMQRALDRFGGDAPAGLCQLVIGGAAVGEALVDHPGVPLISATGSTPMGRAVGARVAARFGRSILELGGNNAMIVTPSADLDMAVRAILFSAVGTTGQRCTSLRRVIVQESIREAVRDRILKAYEQLPIGDPLVDGTLVGPLIDGLAFDAMQEALTAATAQGGVVQGGQRVMQSEFPNAFYVKPAVVEMPAQTETVRQETFAPILYLMGYQDLDQAIALQNDVPQGLSSCIFSTDMRETERFLAAAGSDCGMANVNIGPSGAEIGGAFGGEKETGGGRESGSDSWKAYMRRQTQTINWGTSLPLAQGITFGE
ncbi:MAG: aldehyde dehydrogenase family protein [Magnetospiraceae bacterium]